jgi:hypothetical protein
MAWHAPPAETITKACIFYGLRPYPFFSYVTLRLACFPVKTMPLEGAAGRNVEDPFYKPDGSSGVLNSWQQLGDENWVLRNVYSLAFLFERFGVLFARGRSGFDHCRRQQNNCPFRIGAFVSGGVLVRGFIRQPGLGSGKPAAECCAIFGGHRLSGSYDLAALARVLSAGLSVPLAWSDPQAAGIEFHGSEERQGLIETA